MRMKFIAALVAALVTSAATAQTIQINGAGATFPYPIYSKWFAEYNRLHPNIDITVVHRSEGSGTTYIWVDYLSKVSPEWKQKVGVAASVNWPVGVGGKGNEGVTGLVKQTPGSIGYVVLIYALQNKIAYGS